MGKKKKPFIDKKSAHSFKLVHRSQRDPLQADEESSRHVLIPADQKEQVHEAKRSVDLAEKHSAEQRKFGVFFDDDYDYLQHLKKSGDSHLAHPGESNVSANSGADLLQLPQDVFASQHEEDVGLLNRAAPVSGPRLDWDPDVVAALDSDDVQVNPEDLLEDDFVAKANMEDISEYDVEKEERDRRLASFLKYGSADDDMAEDQSEDGGDDDDQSGIEDESNSEDFELSLNLSGDDMKSRFTDYSLTSSVMKRNKGLTRLDERFEKLMEEYDDDEIGALDDAEVEGSRTTENVVVSQAMDLFMQQQQDRPKLEKEADRGHVAGHLDACHSDHEDSNDDERLVRVSAGQTDEKWDCESILSTYSTLYNHPTKIREPPKEKQRKLLAKTGYSAKEVMEVSAEPAPIDTTRRKGESAEERKSRKQTVKEDRLVKRAAKKTTKLAFKSEYKQQQRSAIANQLQQRSVKVE